MTSYTSEAHFEFDEAFRDGQPVGERPEVGDHGFGVHLELLDGRDDRCVPLGVGEYALDPHRHPAAVGHVVDPIAAGDEEVERYFGMMTKLVGKLEDGDKTLRDVLRELAAAYAAVILMELNS